MPTTSKTTKRRTLLKGVGAAAAATVAGCVGGDDETIEFHFVAATPEEGTQEVLTDAVEEWGEQLDDYEIDPTMEFVGVVDAEPTLNQYLGIDDPPSLVMGNAPIARFHEHLEDTTEFNEEFLDLPEPAYGGQVGPDKQVIVPDHFVIQAKYYRMDIYEEAGVEPPDTWSEHLDVLDALDDHLDGDMHPELLQANSDNTGIYLQDHGTQHSIGLDFLERTGPELDDVRISLGDDDQRQTAIDYHEHFSQVYEYSPETVSYGFFDMISTFVEGAVATTNYTGRLIDNVAAQNPDMLENVGITRFPLPDEYDIDSDYRMGHNPQTLAVPTTDHSDLVFDFLEFYFTTDHYFNRLTGAGPNGIPPTQELFHDDRLAERDDWQNPAAQRYYDYIDQIWDDGGFYMAQYGRTDPPSVYWPAIFNDAGVGLEFSANGYTGRMSPEEVVDDTIEKIEDELPQALDIYLD